MSHNLDALLAKLNEQQRAAVEAEPGPMLILAGAGSGKTRVLTHRIAYMVRAKGIRPWHILAVTFTNKAAEEMAGRVQKLLPDQSESVTVSTFHATAANILRRHIDRLGYTSNYVIYDDSDQVTLLKRVCEELNLPKQAFDPRAFRALIDRAKNQLLWPDMVVAESRTGAGSKLPEVYARYQQRLKAANALDFGDLLLLTVKLLEDHPEVRASLQERYQHLLIDEYQDTNHAQYRMAQLLLNQRTRSICVVGDEDQSIYAFRGADISNILNFNKDFADARVIRLEQNYRSTNVILEAAGAVVAYNRNRLGKNLWTDRPGGEPIHYMEVDTDVEEASRVGEEIRRLKGAHGHPYGDIAVFYRANSQSRLFEEVFNYQQIPYTLVGQGFYDRKEIKDMRAYLQLIYNPLDDASLDRVLNEPARGIGERARVYLFNLASDARTSCYEQLELIAADPGSHSQYGSKLIAFYKLMERLKTAAKTLKVRELIERVLEDTGYKDKLVQAGDVESESRLENLRELMNVAADLDLMPGLPGLQRFLERISLRSQADEAQSDEGRVILMTFHNAKGLEFPVVFMVGMEEGLFPHSRTVDNEQEVEEERRLCYVGMTRAMSRLYLVRARRRRFQGETMLTRPSRFLKEIPSALLAGRRGLGVGDIARRYGLGESGAPANLGGVTRPTPGARPAASARSPVASALSPAEMLRRAAGSVPSAGERGSEESVLEERPARRSVRSAGDDSDPFAELQVGRRVQHPSFGEGLIRGREGPADNPRLTIRFKTVGEKKLMARYAGLEVVYH